MYEWDSENFWINSKKPRLGLLDFPEELCWVKSKTLWSFSAVCHSFDQKNPTTFRIHNITGDETRENVKHFSVSHTRHAFVLLCVNDNNSNDGSKLPFSVTKISKKKEKRRHLNCGSFHCFPSNELILTTELNCSDIFCHRLLKCVRLFAFIENNNKEKTRKIDKIWKWRRKILKLPVDDGNVRDGDKFHQNWTTYVFLFYCRPLTPQSNLANVTHRFRFYNKRPRHIFI